MVRVDVTEATTSLAKAPLIVLTDSKGEVKQQLEHKWLPGLHEQRTKHAILPDELEGAIHGVLSSGASQGQGRELH